MVGEQSDLREELAIAGGSYDLGDVDGERETEGIVGRGVEVGVGAVGGAGEAVVGCYG